MRVLPTGAVQGASLSGSISSSSAGAAWNYVPSTDAQGACAPAMPQQQQQEQMPQHPFQHHQQLPVSQPLPPSQSQVDLESFAASILLDDLQPMSGEDLSGSWGHRGGVDAPRGSECSINDQVMHSAQADSSCADTAWMAEEGFEPALRELAASSPSAAAVALNPFEGLPELECAAAAAAAAPAGLYSSAGRSLIRTASVPPGRQLVDPFCSSGAVAPCIAGDIGLFTHASVAGSGGPPCVPESSPFLQGATAVHGACMRTHASGGNGTNSARLLNPDNPKRLRRPPPLAHREHAGRRRRCEPPQAAQCRRPAQGGVRRRDQELASQPDARRIRAGAPPPGAPLHTSVAAVPALWRLLRFPCQYASICRMGFLVFSPSCLCRALGRPTSHDGACVSVRVLVAGIRDSMR